MTGDEQERPHPTIGPAAEAVGVRRRAIRRRFEAGDLPNGQRVAEPEGQRSWNVSAMDQLAAGFPPDEPTTPDDATESTAGPNELDLLRAEIAEERALRRVAEAVADERARALERADAAIAALRAVAGRADVDGRP